MNYHSELVATVDTVAKKNNLHVQHVEKRAFVSYGGDKDGREKLTATALELSLMGYTVRAFPGCNFIEVSESPEDTTNAPRVKAEETTAELIGRVFSQFAVTFSKEGFAYLTCTQPKARECLSKAAEELSAGGFMVEYFESCNFIRVKLNHEVTEVVHTVYVLMHKADSKAVEDFDPESILGTA